MGPRWGEGHRLSYRRRESSLNHQLMAGSELLRCPRFGENARASARFSTFLYRTRKLRTAWRRGGIRTPETLQASMDELGASLAHYSAGKKASVLERICRLGFGSASGLSDSLSSTLTRIWVRSHQTKVWSSNLSFRDVFDLRLSARWSTRAGPPSCRWPGTSGPSEEDPTGPT
jgi:hypothetical protein